MDMNKIIENSRNMETTVPVGTDNDVSNEIIKVATAVYAKHHEMHPWFRGIDMIEKLKELGKSNVRSHLEKLSDKHILEARLHGNKKVYRLRVIEDE